jgi:hypothetical protein
MFPSVLLAALGGTLLIADGLPALNVESGCRAAAKMGDSLSLDTSLRQCLADEKSARDELENSGRNFHRRCASAVLPPPKPPAIPATSKFSSACKWAATRRAWTSLWIAD